MSTFDTGHSDSVMALVGWWEGGDFRIATGSFDGTIRIWGVDREIKIGGPLSGHRGAVISLVHWRSLDGASRLVSGSVDGTIRLWDLDSGVAVGEPLHTHGAAIGDLVCWRSADGTTQLAAGAADGTIGRWDLESGGALAGPPFAAGQTGVRALECWHDADGGVRLVSGDAGGNIRMWDAVTAGSLPESLSSESTSPVNSIVHWKTPEGGLRLASGGVDGVVRIWEPGASAPVGQITAGHVASVWTLDCWQEPDGSARVASGGGDGRVRVWDLETGALLSESLTGHGPGVWTVRSWREPEGTLRLCSGSLNGTIQFWDPATGAPDGPPLGGHTAPLSAFACWHGADGIPRLVSAGDDGQVLLWDVGNRSLSRPALTGHSGGLLALTSWSDASGAPRIASAGADLVIRIWDPETGGQVGEPLAGHSHSIEALVTWRQAGGGVRLASGGGDGVRLWDPLTGTPVGEPLSGHTGTVRALTCWRRGDGSVRLASAAADGSICVWDPSEGTLVGEPLTGHTAGIRALAHWSTRDGTVRLVSAGEDGTIRLWDPEHGLALRTVEVGAVAMWGVSDAPASVDALGRNVLVQAITEQLQSASTTDPAADDAVGPGAAPRVGPGAVGPAVVTIEGPWGCGKSTLMELIRRRLDTDRGAVPAAVSGRRLTVRQAMAQLRKPDAAPAAPAALGDGSDGPVESGMITAWFNPWAHQSGEQIWAGLASAISQACEPVVCPSDQERERYWFAYNIERTDRHALRRLLRRRIISPLLGVALIAVVLPTALAVLNLGGPADLLGQKVSPAVLALLFPALALVIGMAHTAARFWRGWAVNYLPDPIFHAPTSATSATVPGTAAAHTDAPDQHDPLHTATVSATAGPLYLYQHGVRKLIADITAAGRELIVFIDDLDRCQAAATAEVFEAVNLFLPGLASDGLRARFVIGIDPAVVAAHLDAVYCDSRIALYGDDPSIGWAFLRKLTQLPVTIPQISDQAVDDFLDLITGLPAPDGRPPGPPTPSSAAAPDPPTLPTQTLAQTQSSTPPSGASAPPAQSPQSPRQEQDEVRVIAWRSIEQHPHVRRLLRDRITGQPDRSIREAKRLLNIWQLYQRVLTKAAPLHEPADEITRACHLVTLAEIITRWPALQGALHRRIGDRRGLQLLAAAADSDQRWSQAVNRLDLDPTRHARALANLRSLLCHHDGPAVADLAALLL